MLIRAESLVNKEASARRKTLVVRAINAAILNLAHRLTNLAKEALPSNRSGEVADLNQRRRDPSRAECAQLTPNRADSDTGDDDNEDTIMVQAPALLSDAESTQWLLADQDMFSYLSTAVPDIWTVHDVSAFDPSMLEHSRAHLARRRRLGSGLDARRHWAVPRVADRGCSGQRQSNLRDNPA